MSVAINPDSGKADYTCDHVYAYHRVTGEPTKVCGFTSSGWDTVEQATARGAQHDNEHVTGELMQELTEFEADNGFIRPVEGEA